MITIPLPSPSFIPARLFPTAGMVLVIHGIPFSGVSHFAYIRCTPAAQRLARLRSRWPDPLLFIA